jgi:hypothetical protein
MSRHPDVIDISSKFVGGPLLFPLQCRQSELMFSASCLLLIPRSYSQVNGAQVQKASLKNLSLTREIRAGCSHELSILSIPATKAATTAAAPHEVVLQSCTGLSAWAHKDTPSCRDI